MNISRCIKCGYSLINEELDNHVCRRVIDYRIIEDILWLFDGEIWYPRKIVSAEKLQRDNYDPSDEDDTEPNTERYIRIRTVVKLCLIQNEKCMFAFQKKRLVC